MYIAAIPFLMLGIFITFSASYAYIRLFYHKKPNYPKLQYIGILLLCSLGISYMVGAITGHIGLAMLLTFILPIFFVFYRKRKYPSSETYIKEKYPEKYSKINAPISILAKIGYIVLFLFLIIVAIINF